MSGTGDTDRPLRGLAFPFRVRDGRFAVRSGPDKVADDVRQLLSTRSGDRLMHRTYGGGVHRHLQEPADDALLLLMRHELQRAFEENLPEARLTAPIRVSFRDDEVVVVVDYVVAPSDIARRTEVKLT